jgi:hypothetical protein
MPTRCTVRSDTPSGGWDHKPPLSTVATVMRGVWTARGWAIRFFRTAVGLTAVTLAAIMCIAPATATARAQSPAQLLLMIDTGDRVAAGDQRLRPYNIALDRLSRRCTNPRMRLADFAANVWDMLDKKGIHVTTLRILRGVNSSFPQNWKRTGCVDMFTSYAVLVLKGWKP